MIQIDMQMPKNCLECPACNEYLTCAIPVNGRGWGENDVREFGQGRPEWCPLKEQEAVKPEPIMGTSISDCGKCRHAVAPGMNYCPVCGCRIDWN